MYQVNYKYQLLHILILQNYILYYQNLKILNNIFELVIMYIIIFITIYINYFHLNIYLMILSNLF